MPDPSAFAVTRSLAKAKARYPWARRGCRSGVESGASKTCARPAPTSRKPSTNLSSGANREGRSGRPSGKPSPRAIVVCLRDHLPMANGTTSREPHLEHLHRRVSSTTVVQGLCWAMSSSSATGACGHSHCSAPLWSRSCGGPGGRPATPPKPRGTSHAWRDASKATARGGHRRKGPRQRGVVASGGDFPRPTRGAACRRSFQVRILLPASPSISPCRQP